MLCNRSNWQRRWIQLSLSLSLYLCTSLPLGFRNVLYGSDSLLTSWKLKWGLKSMSSAILRAQEQQNGGYTWYTSVILDIELQVRTLYSVFQQRHGVKVKGRSDRGKFSYCRSGNIYLEFLMLLSFYTLENGHYEEEKKGVARNNLQWITKSLVRVMWVY